MPTCFVIMPITTPPGLVDRYAGDEDHFTHVFDYLFEPALRAGGYAAISPVSSGSDVIQGEIIKNLSEADLVLCDMTALNPNVFFELGIRTALDKPVATVRDELTEQIPFDHSIVNCHTYRSQMDPWVLDKEIPQLIDHISACVDRGGETNTLWKYFGIEAQSPSGICGYHGRRQARLPRPASSISGDTSWTTPGSSRLRTLLELPDETCSCIRTLQAPPGASRSTSSGCESRGHTASQSPGSRESAGQERVRDFFDDVSIGGGGVRGHHEDRYGAGLGDQERPR